MENSSIPDANQAKSQKELADDVALLYSWARIENNAYRDFSRPRTSPSPPMPNGHEKNGAAELATQSPAVRDIAALPISSGVALQRPGHEIYPAIPEHRYDAQVVGAIPESGTPRASGEAGSPGRPPVLAVYSVAGGVGKTTVCANLGKTLCSLGEQVLLVDATGRGLLPFYFGATEQRAGVRKFVAPGGSAPSIQIITGDECTPDWLDRDVKGLMAAAQRTIFDLGPATQSLLPAILAMCNVVLVPLLPDLNSIISVLRIESLLNGPVTGAKSPGLFYFFNRYDEQSGNDRWARDFVVRHCGHRLLPVSLRHGRELTEALQGGFPGMDSTPGSELSHDYLQLALYVRRVAPLSSHVALPGRWSEQ
jgi:cellulose biosynthesis protein BcsQ